MPSIPGAVHPFLLATSLYFIKGHSEVVDTVYFLMKLSSYFLHPWHIRCSFFSLPYTTPEIHEFFHFWHLPFSCPIFFQCLEESFLVMLNMILSCFLLLFSVYLANFTFLYLIWSSHISHTFLKLEFVISF